MSMEPILSVFQELVNLFASLCILLLTPPNREGRMLDMVERDITRETENEIRGTRTVSHPAPNGGKPQPDSEISGESNTGSENE